MTLTKPILSDEQQLILQSVSDLLERFNENYWENLDRYRKYPTELVREFEKAGLMAVPIPTEYGGAGLGLKEACLILEEVNGKGGNAQPFHGQYYLSWIISKYARESVKKKYLPRLARGEIRMQTLALTEAEAGSDTTRIKTFAKKRGDRFVVNGHKIFASRVKFTDLMILVVRTVPYDEVMKKTDGLSVFLVDLRESEGIDALEIETMFNSQTYELFIENLEIPEDNLIGELNGGFKTILYALNPERILLASESVGDARWFIEKSVDYSKNRKVFGRAIGQNQGVQFPIADTYSKLVAADAVRWKAVDLFDSGSQDVRRIGELANIAKYLSAECAWQAANIAMDTFGGYGLSIDTGIQRKFKESRLYKVAPISHNLVLTYIATNVLGLPKSY